MTNNTVGRSSDKSDPKSVGSQQPPTDGVEQVSVTRERINLKWAQVHHTGAGLQNMGNTCFMNAALQCLTYTAPFANYMLTREHSRTCSNPGFCMMCTMENHIMLVFSNPGDVIEPIGVLCELKRIAGHFRYGNQEDAHEFLRYTVEALQKSCLPPGTNLEREAQRSTFIHQVFGGCLRSRVKCLNCEAVSDTFDPFMDIPLEIELSSSVSKALKRFVKAEQLGGENAYKCSECQNMVTATKRFTIHRNPNVLTLALKRFDIFTGGKIEKHVKYPEYLDLRPFMSQSHGDPKIYRLYAVLVHSGQSCNSGHYLCYVKASDERWYLMNDSSVCIRDIRCVLDQKAYLLFYVKSGHADPAGDTKRISELHAKDAAQSHKKRSSEEGEHHRKRQHRDDEDIQQDDGSPPAKRHQTDCDDVKGDGLCNNEDRRSRKRGYSEDKDCTLDNGPSPEKRRRTESDGVRGDHLTSSEERKSRKRPRCADTDSDHGDGLPPRKRRRTE